MRQDTPKEQVRYKTNLTPHRNTLSLKEYARKSRRKQRQKLSDYKYNTANINGNLYGVITGVQEQTEITLIFSTRKLSKVKQLEEFTDSKELPSFLVDANAEDREVKVLHELSHEDDGAKVIEAYRAELSDLGYSVRLAPSAQKALYRCNTQESKLRPWDTPITDGQVFKDGKDISENGSHRLNSGVVVTASDWIGQVTDNAVLPEPLSCDSLWYANPESLLIAMEGTEDPKWSTKMRKREADKKYRDRRAA